MSYFAPILQPILQPISLSLTRAGVAVWSPRALFAAGDLGAVYDRSDLSTEYQDSAGMTGVTAAGQPVGLALDKRLGLVRGPQAIVNGDFASGLTGWTQVGTPTVSEVVGGRYHVKGSGGSYQGVKMPATVSAGKSYEVTADVQCVSGAVRLDAVDGDVVQGSTAGFAITGAGTYSARFICTATGSSLGVQCVADSIAGGGEAYFDNVSVRELPGNHATQATTTARPLYQAGPSRVVYDGVDDKLTTTFAALLGSACTVARAIPGTGAQILTGQTVGTTFDDSVTNAALVIINRALTASETTSLTAWLNRKAGV